ncbi:hypothetical protein HYX11_00580 [Candidatus Woesearchaeota archaeon]|nr:hypothetical protein [Candidatus Woesearchaeota archaeon]
MTTENAKYIKYSESNGKGKFKIGEIEKETSFKLEFYLGQDAILYMDEDFFSEINRSFINKKKNEPIIASLSGILENGAKIRIDHLILIQPSCLEKGKSTPIKFKVFSPVIISKYLQNSSPENEEIHFLITNFEFTGCDKTIYPNGGWKLNQLSVNVGGYTLIIKQVENYENIIKQLKHKNSLSAITAEIIIKSPIKDRDKIYPIVEDICSLCSFANGNSVVPVIEKHFSNVNLVFERISSMRIDPFSGGNQLIPNLPPEVIRDFVDNTHTAYVNYKDKLGLNILINYYLLMKSNPILDIRCLLGFVLLECLSDHAQEYYSKLGKPIDSSLRKGQISKLKKILPRSNNLSKKTLDKIIDEFVYKYPTLQDSINQLMNDFGMRQKRGEGRLFELRKSFIHKGMYPKGTTDHIVIYRSLVHFIDRLILNILGYKSIYLNIADNYKIEEINPK